MESRRDTQRARRLRHEQTDAERKLWSHLRGRHLCAYKFRRQYPLSGYVVDFVCPEQKLIVELDGGQHADDVRRDEWRSNVLARSGFRVLRYWNDEVLLATEAVLEDILRQLQAPPSPRPSPASGRGG